MEKLEKIVFYALITLMAVMFAYLLYSTGVNTARAQVCAKVGGVYVQTYNDGVKCINTTTIDLK